jgi:hypothetical protein
MCRMVFLQPTTDVTSGCSVLLFWQQQHCLLIYCSCHGVYWGVSVCVPIFLANVPKQLWLTHLGNHHP